MSAKLLGKIATATTIALLYLIAPVNALSYADDERIEALTKDMEDMCNKLELLEREVAILRKEIERMKTSTHIQTPPIHNQHTDLRAPEEVTSDPQKQYDLALAAYKAGQNTQAAVAFDEFIRDHHEHVLVGNVYFWRGMLFAKNKEYEHAATSYLKSYKAAPEGAKASDALLQLAESLAMVGKNEQGCAIIAKLKEEFPAKSKNSKATIDKLWQHMKCAKGTSNKQS